MKLVTFELVNHIILYAVLYMQNDLTNIFNVYVKNFVCYNFIL